MKVKLANTLVSGYKLQNKLFKKKRFSILSLSITFIFFNHISIYIVGDKNCRVGNELRVKIKA